jgi:5-methylcytosine-specific restriction endonuclease McrA
MIAWRLKNKERLKQESKARWSATLADPERIAKHREENNRYYAALTEKEKQVRFQKQRPAELRYKETHRQQLAEKRASNYWANPGVWRGRANAAYRALTPEERKLLSAGKTGYLKQYRAENLDRLKKANADRYIAKREELLAKSKIYYRKNPEPFKARAKARHAADPKAVSQRARKWGLENPERRAEISKIAFSRRRDRIDLAGGVITDAQFRELFNRQGGKCAGCKKSVGKYEETTKWHHDHVMPVALGGANTIENAQILCPRCNRHKHAKHPQKWAEELGRLFA